MINTKYEKMNRKAGGMRSESVPWRDGPGHLSSSQRRTGRWWSGSVGEGLKLEQIVTPRLHTPQIRTHTQPGKRRIRTQIWTHVHAQERGGGGRFDILKF